MNCDLSLRLLISYLLCIKKLKIPEGNPKCSK